MTLRQLIRQALEYNGLDTEIKVRIVKVGPGNKRSFKLAPVEAWSDWTTQMTHGAEIIIDEDKIKPDEKPKRKK